MLYTNSCHLLLRKRSPRTYEKRPSASRFGDNGVPTEQKRTMHAYGIYSFSAISHVGKMRKLIHVCMV